MAFSNQNSTAPKTSTTMAASSTVSLVNFDKCIEICDSLTASSGCIIDTVLDARKSHGIPDCSILVSPDGDLLLIPTGTTPESLFAAENTTSNIHSNDSKNDPSPPPVENTEGLEEELGSKTITSSGENTDGKADNNHSFEDADDEEDDVELNPTETFPIGEEVESSTSSFTELMRNSKEDYRSAVFLGTDLHKDGDKYLNRFSAKGWSIPATSFAMQQTGQTITELAHFCEQVVLARKECAARTAIACDRLRNQNPRLTQSQQPQQPLLQLPASQWEIIDPRASEFEWTPNRTGPWQSPSTSSLYQAMSAVEQYYHDAAETESQRWRVASLERNGVLPAMNAATDQFWKRAQARHQALDETSKRAMECQEKLYKLKLIAEKRWNAVYRAEERVTKRIGELLNQRSRERQKARLKQLRAEQQMQQQLQQQQGEEGNATATERNLATPATTTSTGGMASLSDEVWDMVSSVTESMEEGTFEPVNLQLPVAATVSSDAASVLSDDQSTTSSLNPGESNGMMDPTPPTTSTSIPDREKVEQELGLYELRGAAMKAEDDVQDAADALLNILSALDTARRSARVAAESALVSTGNAQLTCLRSMVSLERASLEERLRELEKLEEIFDQVDVRADLDAYITADKQEKGGTGHLRDDDDGGIASALAILSSHVDGSMGNDSGRNRTVSQDMTELSEKDKKASPSDLKDMIETLFKPNPALAPDASSDEDTARLRTEFEDTVDFLCSSASENSYSAKGRRSVMCYALNASRSQSAKIQTQIQFDAVCRVFWAILTGCHAEKSSGVLNAKMIMMLAQTFYIDARVEDLRPYDDEKVMDDSSRSYSSPARQERRSRLYVKNRLVDHEIWSHNYFWDDALRLQISESLTQSGVLSNFERQSKRASRQSEWAETRKIRWYDLNYTERIEAASQVHAVVFAQLSALAHSMIEFGCGLDRSCAFVRRMAIRNQLPSSQRTMLLLHLMKRDDVGKRESRIIGNQKRTSEKLRR
jgi:hypothetical protein